MNRPRRQSTGTIEHCNDGRMDPSSFLDECGPYVLAPTWRWTFHILVKRVGSAMASVLLLFCVTTREGIAFSLSNNHHTCWWLGALFSSCANPIGAVVPCRVPKIAKHKKALPPESKNIAKASRIFFCMRTEWPPTKSRGGFGTQMQSA